LKYFCNILISILAIGLVHCDSGSPGPLPAYIPSSGPILSDWESVGGQYVYTDAPTTDSEGNLYYAAIAQNRIYRMTPAGEVSVFAENTARSMGLMFAPDGRLISCRSLDAQIVAYDMQGDYEVLLEGELTQDPDVPKEYEFCNGLVVSSSGGIWFNDRINQEVIYLDANGEHQVVASGFRPNGIILSHDEKTLVTTDSNEPKLWAFDVQADGSLQEKPGYFDPVRMGKFKNRSKMSTTPGTNGMAIDNEGRYYTPSFVGIQVFSPEGKFLGIIKGPNAFVSGLKFAGTKSEYLYATASGGLYRLSIGNSGVTNPVN
jgi:gluconolactonase